jgi:hypothetical protein
MGFLLNTTAPPLPSTMGREASLDLFHAIGKVLYAKSKLSVVVTGFFVLFYCESVLIQFALT